MKPPQPLYTYARWVLWCWLLALWVGYVWPVLHPQHTEWVCTEAGHSYLVTLQVDDANTQSATAHEHCALCLAPVLAHDAGPWYAPPLTAGSFLGFLWQRPTYFTPLAGVMPPPRGPPHSVC